MTIASFAKPAVLAVALLGAASASLAVNSADQSPADNVSQVIDLQAEAQVASGSANDEEAVEIVTAKEVAVTEKPREPAKLRSPQPVFVRPPAPANVFAPPAPGWNGYPVYQPLDIRVGGPNLMMNLKLRTHEAKVAQLQLESKKLEIASFDAKGEEKEVLLNESRKMLLMAEAEELQMQVERQQTEIKELEKALKEEAKSLGKQTERTASDAKFSPEQITYPSYVPDPGLQPGDQIKIEVEGAFPDRPINDIFTIEPTGTVALGATYGRAKVVGMSVIDAEKAILEQLETIVDDLQVQVTLVGRGAYRGGGAYGGGYGGPSTIQPTRQPAPKKSP